MGRSPSPRRRHRDRKKRRRRRRSSSSSSSSRSRSRRRSRTRERSSRDKDGSRARTITEDNSTSSKPTVVSASVSRSTNDVDVASDLRRSRALSSIEDAGFAQATFVSSRTQKVSQIALPGESTSSEFAFGTNLEKKEVRDEQGDEKDRVLVKVDPDSLCHQNWRPSAAREKRWLRRLLGMREQIAKT